MEKDFGYVYPDGWIGGEGDVIIGRTEESIGGDDGWAWPYAD